MTTFHAVDACIHATHATFAVAMPQVLVALPMSGAIATGCVFVACQSRSVAVSVFSLLPIGVFCYAVAALYGTLNLLPKCFS